MTSFERFEREIPRLMDELAPFRLPDYMDDMLRATARTAQRPAWRSPERWFPMGEIARTVPGPSIPWRPLILVALLAVLLTAGLLVAGGSTQRLPDPFGPAANGSMFYHGDDGVIYAMDPVSGTSTAVVSGPETYQFPLPSRDGQRILYDHKAGIESQLFVADADGANARSLDASLTGWTWTDWAPEGDRLAVISIVAGRPALSFVAMDGSGVTPSRLDREAKVAWFLPDGRLAMMAAETPGDRCQMEDFDSVCALFVSDADGGNPQMLLDAATFAGLSVHPSPDGQQLLYVRWADGEAGRLHAYDIATGEDRQVRIDNQDPAENINEAWFSPDGSRILFDRFEADGEHWAVVPSAGGDAVNIGRPWQRPEGTSPEAQFTPDGRSVLAFYATSPDGTGELWLYDATGAGEGRQLTAPTTYAPVFQRVAPDGP